MIQSGASPVTLIEEPSAEAGGADAAEDRLDEMRTMADRPLLAVMQASLSLIGFGFTIYQIFSDLAARAGVTAPNRSAGRLGLALLSLGLLLLASGLWGHARYSRGLEARRARLIAQGLLRASSTPRI